MALTEITSKSIKDGEISNADINASADIAGSKIADNAITLAKMAGGTDGQIITYDASGDPVAVGPGNDGEVLTSTGAGSPPAFEALPASNNYTHPNHSGEVTSTGDGATVITDDVVDEANLKVSNSPTNGYFLSAQSGNTGGLTWAAAGVTEDAQDNIQIGTDAGADFSGTSAVNNTLIGESAGKNITTGDRNICLGNNAGRSILDGADQIVIGYNSLYHSSGNHTGQENVIIGNYIGTDTTVWADKNTIVGLKAGQNITKASNNVFIGFKSGLKATEPVGNVGIGHLSPGGLTSGDFDGDYNTVVGYNSLSAITTGNSNSVLGLNAALDITTGSNNLCLGKYAGTQWSPSGSITTGDNVICLGSNTSDLYCADTSISSSDQRDKTDIVNFTHGLDWIKKLRPVSYRWDRRSTYATLVDGLPKGLGTPDGSKKEPKQHLGFLAQEVLAIEQADGFASSRDNMLIVNQTPDETAYGLKYERFIPILVNAIKELSTEVDTLKTKVAALEAG